jgi:penicillin amidase
MAAVQLDDRTPAGPVLTPYLLDVELPTSYWDDGQRLLQEWDFSQPADSGAAAYFNVVWRNVLERTFHDELEAEELRPDGGQRWVAVMEALLERPDDPWWDDVSTEDRQETRDEILIAALRDARDELTSLQSLDPTEWSWGALHRLDLENSTLGTSGIGPVEWLVNRGPWPSSGGAATVNATAWNAAEGYGVTAAPSMRMVISMADFDDSRWINLTGVSGHPASDHYTDQTHLWAEGETLPWPFSEEAVDAAGEQELSLVPDEDGTE